MPKMPPKINDAQIMVSQAMQPMIEANVEALGDLTGDPAIKFCMFIFQDSADGQPGWMQYGSNANREDIKNCLKQFIAQWEAAPDSVEVKLHERKPIN